MWLVDSVQVDVIDHLELGRPTDLARLPAHSTDGKITTLEVAELWREWLRPAIDKRETCLNDKLAQLVKHDVISVRQMRKLNALREMSETCCVNILFSLDREDCVHQRLQAPSSCAVQDSSAARYEPEHIILETPLA